MRRQAPEAALQKAVSAYCWAVLPPQVIWSAIPSGGGGRVRGAILQAMGLRRGLPDLFFAWPGGVGWIELKSDKGKMSVDQVEVANILIALDHKFALCRSVAEVAAALKAWGAPSREVVQLPAPASVNTSTAFTIENVTDEPLSVSPAKTTLFRMHPSRRP